MKLKIKKIFSFLLIILVLYYNTFNVYAEDGATQDELNRISTSQDNIKKIQESKKQMQNVIKKLNTLKNDMKQYIEALDKELEQLIDELNNTIENIDLKQIEINMTNENLELAKKDEEKQYNDMKLRIKYFYERDYKTILESILSGKSLKDLLTKAEYVQNITDYDRKKLDDLIMIKNLIAEYEEKLEIEKAELVSLKEIEMAKKEEITTLIDEKTKELQDTQNKINTSKSELKKLEAEQKKQEATIQAIERAIAARSNGKRILKGGLIWPCPDSNRITSQFGKRTSPTKGASSNHQGIDIGAPTGTKVIAAASGEVVIAQYSYSAGNYIMIDHGSSVFTIYMHLSKMSVPVGTEVVQGQKIGEVGQTGYATGPHLHFGVRKNGSYVNPLTFVG